MQPQSYSDLIYPIADEIRSYCHAEMNFWVILVLDFLFSSFLTQNFRNICIYI